MEIDYIFTRGLFSSKISARAKILTEWKTAFNVTGFLHQGKFFNSENNSFAGFFEQPSTILVFSAV